jgi:hypothetical protein
VDAGAAYYDVNYTTTEPSGWTFKSMMVTVPASDVDFRVGVRKLGNSNEPILICNPILTRVGNRYDSFSSTAIAAHEAVFDHSLIDTAVQDGGIVQALTVGLGYTPDGYWTMDDDAASTDVLDSSGNSYTLTAQQNTEDITTTGAISAALTFNGTSDYLVNAAATFTDTSGTISAWVLFTDDTSGGTILASSDEASTTRYFQWFYSNAQKSLILMQRDNDTLDDLRATWRFKSGTWYHVALTSDGSTIAMYVNGEALTITASGGSNGGDWLGDTSARDNFTLGAMKQAAVSTYLEGSLDDVRYYSECLTDDQIAYLHETCSATSTGTLTMDGEVGITTSFVDADGNTITVTKGIITAVTPPGP